MRNIKKMTLLEIIKKVKIDFTQCLIELDFGSILDYQFEITPNDFLTYCKQDFKSNDNRGSINALTNSKRAIDCQTDKVFCLLGLDPNDFPPIIEEFVDKSKHSPSKKDIPLRLRFIQALNLAPAGIIANARLLRNKLEHYYKKPTNEEVSGAIDIAGLFILATENKLKSMWDFYITDNEKYSSRPPNEVRMPDCISISFDDKKFLFNVVGCIGTENHLKMSFSNTDIEFYFLFKIATSFDHDNEVQDSIIDLLELIGHPIPSKNVKVEIT